MTTLLLGSGCFWGREYHLSQLPGVVSTRVGFAGGDLPDPTYLQVCERDTGHAEVVEVTYDKRRLTTEALLTEFFTLHDFERDRDRERGQYRSAIFAVDDVSELAIAHRMLSHLRAAALHPTTQVAHVKAFYPAEDRHQRYCATRGMTPERRDYARVRRLLKKAN